MAQDYSGLLTGLDTRPINPYAGNGQRRSHGGKSAGFC